MVSAGEKFYIFFKVGSIVKLMNAFSCLKVVFLVISVLEITVDAKFRKQGNES